jgi:hypothetical protein
MIYQRLCSIPEQIQTIFSVKVSNHVAGHEWSVLAFSYSNLNQQTFPGQVREKTYATASTILLSP